MDTFARHCTSSPKFVHLKHFAWDQSNKHDTASAITRAPSSHQSQVATSCVCLFCLALFLPSVSLTVIWYDSPKNGFTDLKLEHRGKQMCITFRLMKAFDGSINLSLTHNFLKDQMTVSCLNIN